LSEVARKRLAAIREFSDLGAGFRIAALDLEIRGAGNLLGGEQHGHIDAVGFDLYCNLLEQTVQEIKGEQPVQESPAAVNLNLDIRIPEDYVGETSQRLRLYKRIASGKSTEQLAALREEITDRHGPFPEKLESLFAYADLRILATELGIETIDRKAGRILIKFSNRSPVEPTRLLALIRNQPGVSFSPGGVLAVEENAASGQKTLDQVKILLQIMN
jgi:transcription-repair coupling factor (superfamily II helicase)